MKGTKKQWIYPQAVGEVFTPNEYIAACGDHGKVYKFECNAGNSKKKYAVKNARGKVQTISGMYVDGGWRGVYYHPCGDTHEADSNSGFITGLHIDDASTLKDENIAVIVWTENNTDVHCTTNLNMSSWETAKS